MPTITGFLGRMGNGLGERGGGCCLGAERALSVLIWRYGGMERYAIRFRTYPWWEEDVDFWVVFSCSGSLKPSRLIEGKISATRRLGGERRRLSNWAWVVPCGALWCGLVGDVAAAGEVKARSARGVCGTGQGGGLRRGLVLELGRRASVRVEPGKGLEGCTTQDRAVEPRGRRLLCSGATRPRRLDGLAGRCTVYWVGRGTGWRQ